MEERQDAVERLLALDEAGNPRAALHRVRAQVAVAQNGALGDAGGAAGVLQQRGVVENRPRHATRQRAVVHELRPGQRILRPRLGRQLGARLPRFRDRQAEQHPLAARQRLGDVDADDALDPQVGREVGDGVDGLVPDDREPRAVVLELVPQFTCRVERVVLDDDRAEAQRRVERDDVLRAVGQHDRHPVARGHPEPAQAFRSAVDARAELPIRHGRAEELQSGPGAVPRDGRGQHLRQGLGHLVDLGGDAVGVGRQPRAGLEGGHAPILHSAACPPLNTAWGLRARQVAT